MNADVHTLWSNEGGHFGPDFTTTEAAKAGGTETFDVTTFVNEMITGTRDNYGFLITPATSPDLSQQMQDHIYYSSEYEDVEKRPALILDDGIIPVLTQPKTKYQELEISQNRDYLTIQGPKGTSIALSLFTIDGKLIKRVSNTQGEIHLFKKDLHSQLILVKVDCDKLTFYEKVMLQ